MRTTKLTDRLFQLTRFGAINAWPSCPRDNPGLLTMLCASCSGEERETVNDVVVVPPLFKPRRLRLKGLGNLAFLPSQRGAGFCFG
jgi:hypothetical protein